MKIIVGKKSKSEKSVVNLSIISKKPLWKDNFGRILIDTLLKYGFVPNKILTSKNERFSFSDENIKRALNGIKPTKGVSVGDIFINDAVYLFSGKPLNLFSDISFQGGRDSSNHNEISLSVKSFNTSETKNKLVDWFVDNCEMLIPDFARIQYYTSEEIEEARRGFMHDSMMSSRHLMIGIPDIYGVTIFGKPYQDLFGKERILSAPCYKAQELPDGLIWMQLTEHVFDERGSKASLEEVRERVKAHLDRNAFFKGPNYWEQSCTVPEFDLSEIRQKIPWPEGR